MKILIIEDELKLAAAIKKALESQNYAVDVAHDGEEGYNLASFENYDLIISDIMLPLMDGVEVCRRLRQDKIMTPILMLTAKGQISDKTTGLDSGADDYMVKPFSFTELFSRIRALVRRAKHQPQPEIQFAGLSLNPATFKVFKGEQEIKLSGKEFAILEYLFRHPDQVISKDQILNHVWDFEADVLPSTVEVHIKNLRDKIEKPFGDKIIHTVRGFGYELRSDEK